MNETSKSMRRRWCEHAQGVFPWREIFVGNIIDVGAGDDPLRFDNVTAFDQAQGDANNLSNYFEPDSFDLIHASHVLEHLFNPLNCLRDWLTLLKIGGHIVVTVPDIGAYEDFKFPSRFNADHKCSFSMIYLGSVFPTHIHVPTMLGQLSDTAEVRLARYVEHNFDWHRRNSEDQTFREENGCEIWNEWVILVRKK